MSICYDFQKWNIVTLSLVLAVNLIGLGIFALPGIGHIYVGKLGKGIAILVGGVILYVISIVGIIFISTPVYYGQTDWIIISVIGVIGFGVAYIVLFIWQIFNARKLAKKFNESVKTTEKEPW